MAALTEQELDELLAKKKPVSEAELDKMLTPEEPILEQVKRGAIKSLPLVGGTLGAAFLGGIPGAGVGAVIGGSLKNMLSDDVTKEQALLEPLMEGAAAMSGEAIAPGVAAMATKGLKAAGSGALAVGKKIASNATMIPEKVMETYAKRLPEVEAIGGDILTKADEIRAGASKAVEQFKSSQNAQITKALEGSGEVPVDLSKVEEILIEGKAKLHPVFKADQVAKIDQQLSLIQNFKEGLKGKSPTVDDLYNLGSQLQSQAEYLAPGQVFKKKDFADLTMQKAASRARMELNKLVPDIAEANSQLAKIRRMEGNFNKNLITPEKPFNALLTAGSGQNQTAAKQLESLGNLVKFPILGEAEKLAAAKTFNEAGILSDIGTGARNNPLALGGASSALFMAGAGNIPGAVASAAGAFATTPIGIKTLIKTGQKVAQIGKQVKILPSDSYVMADQLARRALQAGLSPQQVDKELKNSVELTNVEKAKLRTKVMRMGQ